MFLFFDIALVVSLQLEIEANLKDRRGYILKCKKERNSILYYAKRVRLSKFCSPQNLKHLIVGTDSSAV
jgi:hypothetical protein